ncbi:hypothetical protein Q1M62_00520 (plasmid) [Sinorhizobium meliloti]|nr:hypothetical protein LZK74_00530 [Sinorhizobium meliloti]WKL28183.1 hypothetical protein Q1M65_00520 [Sinorhizobium meliloti]WKL33747.1 hypothetical protein Q1M62_00520 [Sinorhizobium meliloti]
MNIFKQSVSRKYNLEYIEAMQKFAKNDHLRTRTYSGSAHGLKPLLFALPALALVQSALAQEASPLAGNFSQEVNFPTGARLNSSYDEIGGSISLPVARGSISAATAKFGAAAEIQARLPANLRLGPGSTTRISGDVPGGRSDSVEAAPDAAPARYVTLYQVSYEEIPLSKGSDYLAIVDEAGRLLHTRQRSLPTAVDATTPTVTPETAVALARDDAGAAFGGGEPQVGEPRLEIWVDSNLQGRLAWTFDIDSPSLIEPDSRRYWIAAVGEPGILNWESRIFHGHHGLVTGTLWTESSSSGRPTANQGLQDLDVVRTGSAGGMTRTTSDGRYGFVGGSGTGDLTAKLHGPHSVVENQAGADFEITKNGGADDPIDLNFGASGEFTLAEVSAFQWTNLAFDLAGEILDPSSDLVDLSAIPTRVNINSTCNAYYFPSQVTINFFRAGGSCPNTAYSDVVLHEYGHAVDHAKGDILDGGYSEGFGDALAILGTRQSCLGRDFFGANTCLRQATDLIMWPPASGEGVHAIGRRYAGFTWELVEQLKDTFDDNGAFGIAERLVLGAAAASPSDIPDAVHLMFLVDDDDGNLANGTPHFEALAAAADSRNIPRPDDPDATAAAGAVTASAHVPFVPRPSFSANSNILQTSFTLGAPANVHVSVSSSARVPTNAPQLIYTGFYDGSSPNVMWTYSLREITLQHPGEWSNLSSDMAVQLPAGNHTIYWKLWTGETVELSSGTLLVEAFGRNGAPVAVVSVGATRAADLNETTDLVPRFVNAIDDRGARITKIDE